MSVYVIIATYCAVPWIETCLDSLRQSSHPIQVIVVDNASPDETVAIVQRFPEVIFLPQPENIGFGQANNIGIRYAIDHGAEFVFLLNQDTRIEPDTIGQLVQCAQTKSEFGILSPLHLNGDGTLFDGGFTGYLRPALRSLLFDLKFGSLKPVYPLSFVNAAAWLVRVDCLKQVGGFDPLFFMYGEDGDLCNRLLYHQFKIGIVPSATIFHYRGGVQKGPKNWSARRKKRVNQFKARMLLILKKPHGKFAKAMIVWIIKTICLTLDMLADRNWLNLAGLLGATGDIMLELPRIQRHRKKCQTRGPHWF